jgi:hypothetical protein
MQTHTRDTAVTLSGQTEVMLGQTTYTQGGNTVDKTPYQFHVNDHVDIWQILDPGPGGENLDLQGHTGRIVQIGTQWPGESYGVVLDAYPDYFPLAFHAAELRPAPPGPHAVAAAARGTVLQPLVAIYQKENQ